MASIVVKKGNTRVLEILCKDENGATITTLASAEEIEFHVKEEKDSIATKIAKSLVSGIVINTPSTGYITITLLPTDTALPPKGYPMGLQIKWDSDNIYEAYEITIDGVIVNTLKIVQDTVQ
jgi:hypothetical protein